MREGVDTPEEENVEDKEEGKGRARKLQEVERDRVAGLKHKWGISHKVVFRIKQSIKIQQQPRERHSRPTFKNTIWTVLIVWKCQRHIQINTVPVR